MKTNRSLLKSKYQKNSSCTWFLFKTLSNFELVNSWNVLIFFLIHTIYTSDEYMKIFTIEYLFTKYDYFFVLCLLLYTANENIHSYKLVRKKMVIITFAWDCWYFDECTNIQTHAHAQWHCSNATSFVSFRFYFTDVIFIEFVHSSVVSEMH